MEIAAANLFEGEDTRLYAKICIGEIPVVGLLDSGATVACLGKDCISIVEKAGLEVRPYKSIIKTADGSAHNIVGRVKAEVSLNNRKNDFTFICSLC